MYVPRSLWPSLKDRLVGIVEELKMGDVTDFTNFMGAVIDQRSFKKISGYLDDARKNATVLTGGIARYVMERASAGMVGVNVGVPVPREPFSFGGWYESRFGVGDITGKGSIEFWTQSKKLTTKWNREAGVNWMS